MVLPINDFSRYHMLNLHSFFEGKGVEFRLFQFDNYDPSRPVGRKGGLHAGQLKAYVQLCLAMNYRALHARSASFTPLQSENQRYTMRCWLLRLGFIGDEFATRPAGVHEPASRRYCFPSWPPY